MVGWLRMRRRQQVCFHHHVETQQSWVTSEPVAFDGISSRLICGRCYKVWLL